jgi:hypothetical protein
MGWGFDGMGVRWPPRPWPGVRWPPPAIEGAAIEPVGAVALHGGKAPTAPKAIEPQPMQNRIPIPTKQAPACGGRTEPYNTPEANEIENLQNVTTQHC